MKSGKEAASFVVCVSNDGAEDLDVRKVYQVVPDRVAARDGFLRILDESGEDYLYPSTYFVPVRVPPAARELMAISSRR
ncbi:MAG: hypothetical protein ABI995_04435 [Acidobacteriota bacterium]